MPKSPNFRLEKGFIDPLSLIGVAFLIVTIAVGTAVTNKTDISLSLNKMASAIEDVGMTITGKSYSTKSTPVPTPVLSNPSTLNTQIGKTSTKDSNGKTSSGTSNSNATSTSGKTSPSTSSSTQTSEASSCTCIGGIYTGSGCGSLIDKKCSSSSTDTTSATNTSSSDKQESTSTTETETKTSGNTSNSNTTPSTRTCSVGRCSEGSCKISSASVPYSESCPVSECYSNSGCKTSTTNQTSPSSCTCVGGIYTGSGCGSLIDKKCGTQTNTSSNSQSGSCNATILSYTGCGGGECGAGEVSQTWRTVTCGITTICKPIDECKTAAIGSFCEGGKMDPTSSNYCKYGCVPDINGGKCKDAPVATKKETGSTCSSGNECQSGNCYSGSSTLGGSPFDTLKTCRAASIETIDTVTRNTNTIAAAGDLAILGGLAGPAIGEAALAGYSYGTAYLSTLPTSIQTALAVGGTTLGYVGVTAGTVACINNPYSDACIAYIAGIQGDPMAMIQLAQSADKLTSTKFGYIKSTVDNSSNSQIVFRRSSNSPYNQLSNMLRSTPEDVYSPQTNLSIIDSSEYQQAVIEYATNPSQDTFNRVVATAPESIRDQLLPATSSIRAGMGNFQSYADQLQALHYDTIEGIKYTSPYVSATTDPAFFTTIGQLNPTVPTNTSQLIIARVPTSRITEFNAIGSIGEVGVHGLIYPSEVIGTINPAGMNLEQLNQSIQSLIK